MATQQISQAAVACLLVYSVNDNITEGPVPALAYCLYVWHMWNRCFRFKFDLKLHEGSHAVI